MPQLAGTAPVGVIGGTGKKAYHKARRTAISKLKRGITTAQDFSDMTGLLIRALSQSHFALAALLTLICSTTALGVVRRHDTAPAHYRELVDLPEFASVGSVVPSDGYFGSGTLIAPNWVLTAAHVVDHYSSSELSFGLSPNMSQSSEQTAVRAVHILQGTDMALLELDGVVNAKPAVRYRGTNELGRIVTFVGYGYQGTGLNGEDEDTGGERFAARNVIDRMGSITFTVPNPDPITGAIFPITFPIISEPDWVVWTDFDDPAAQFDWFSFYNLESGPLQELEGTTAHGDSGGGGFITVDGVPQLALVISGGRPIPDLPESVEDFFGAFSSRGPTEYGALAEHRRVSHFNSWIDGVLGANYFNDPDRAFDDPLSWSRGELSDSSIDAVFNHPSSYEVSLDQSHKSRNLRIEAGVVAFKLNEETYEVARDLEIGQPRAATLKLAGPGTMSVVDDAHIHPLGELVVTQSTLIADELIVNGSLVSTGGTLELRLLSGLGEITVASDILQVNASERSTFSGRIDGNGTVALSGELRLNSEHGHAGKLRVEAGGELEVRGQTFYPSSSISGLGTVRFSSGSSTVNGTYDVSGLTSVSGGAVYFEAAAETQHLDVGSNLGRVDNHLSHLRMAAKFQKARKLRAVFS